MKKKFSERKRRAIKFIILAILDRFYPLPHEKDREVQVTESYIINDKDLTSQKNQKLQIQKQ